MRAMRSALGVLCASVLIGSAAYGVFVHETFNQYSGTYTTDWYWFVNDGAPYISTWLYDLDSGPGVDKAAYMVFDDGTSGYTLNPAINNTIRFQTHTLDSGLPADWFYAIADVVGQGANGSVVTGVHFYFGVDPDHDNYEDTLYVSPAIPSSGSNPSGWEYESTHSIVNGTWQVWTWNGSRFVWDGSTTVTGVGSAITDDMLVLGLQFDVPAFSGTSPYFTIWVDNVVPEPGALLLAAFGAFGVLMRRPRRTA